MGNCVCFHLAPKQDATVVTSDVADRNTRRDWACVDVRASQRSEKERIGSSFKQAFVTCSRLPLEISYRLVVVSPAGVAVSLSPKMALTRLGGDSGPVNRTKEPELEERFKFVDNSNILWNL